MKNSFIVVLLAALYFTSCSKPAEGFTSIEQATVYSVKYPCGPACTAKGWILQTAGGTMYEPTNLPLDFTSHDLMVEVMYQKTGKHADPYFGTGKELIIIEQIRKR